MIILEVNKFWVKWTIFITIFGLLLHTFGHLGWFGIVVDYFIRDGYFLGNWYDIAGLRFDNYTHAVANGVIVSWLLWMPYQVYRGFRYLNEKWEIVLLIQTAISFIWEGFEYTVIWLNRHGYWAFFAWMHNFPLNIINDLWLNFLGSCAVIGLYYIKMPRYNENVHQVRSNLYILTN